MMDRLEELERSIRIQRLPKPIRVDAIIFCHACDGVGSPAVWQLIAQPGRSSPARNMRLCQEHLDELTSSLTFLAKHQHRGS